MFPTVSLEILNIFSELLQVSCVYTKTLPTEIRSSLSCYLAPLRKFTYVVVAFSLYEAKYK